MLAASPQPKSAAEEAAEDAAAAAEEVETLFPPATVHEAFQDRGKRRALVGRVFARLGELAQVPAAHEKSAPGWAARARRQLEIQLAVVSRLFQFYSEQRVSPSECAHLFEQFERVGYGGVAGVGDGAADAALGRLQTWVQSVASLTVAHALNLWALPSLTGDAVRHALERPGGADDGLTPVFAVDAVVQALHYERLPRIPATSGCAIAVLAWAAALACVQDAAPSALARVPSLADRAIVGLLQRGQDVEVLVQRALPADAFGRLRALLESDLLVVPPRAGPDVRSALAGVAASIATAALSGFGVSEMPQRFTAVECVARAYARDPALTDEFWGEMQASVSDGGAGAAGSQFVRAAQHAFPLVFEPLAALVAGLAGTELTARDAFEFFARLHSFSLVLRPRDAAAFVAERPGQQRRRAGGPELAEDVCCVAGRPVGGAGPAPLSWVLPRGSSVAPNRLLAGAAPTGPAGAAARRRTPSVVPIGASAMLRPGRAAAGPDDFAAAHVKAVLFPYSGWHYLVSLLDAYCERPRSTDTAKSGAPWGREADALWSALASGQWVEEPVAVSAERVAMALRLIASVARAGGPALAQDLHGHLNGAFPGRAHGMVPLLFDVARAAADRAPAVVEGVYLVLAQLAPVCPDEVLPLMRVPLAAVSLHFSAATLAGCPVLGDGAAGPVSAHAATLAYVELVGTIVQMHGTDPGLVRGCVDHVVQNVFCQLDAWRFAHIGERMALVDACLVLFSKVGALAGSAATLLLHLLGNGLAVMEEASGYEAATGARGVFCKTSATLERACKLLGNARDAAEPKLLSVPAGPRRLALAHVLAEYIIAPDGKLPSTLATEVARLVSVLAGQRYLGGLVSWLGNLSSAFCAAVTRRLARTDGPVELQTCLWRLAATLVQFQAPVASLLLDAGADGESPAAIDVAAVATLQRSSQASLALAAACGAFVKALWQHAAEHGAVVAALGGRAAFWTGLDCLLARATALDVKGAAAERLEAADAVLFVAGVQAAASRSDNGKKVVKMPVEAQKLCADALANRRVWRLLLDPSGAGDSAEQDARTLQFVFERMFGSSALATLQSPGLRFSAVSPGELPQTPWHTDAPRALVDAHAAALASWAQLAPFLDDDGVRYSLAETAVATALRRRTGHAADERLNALVWDAVALLARGVAAKTPTPSALKVFAGVGFAVSDVAVDTGTLAAGVESQLAALLVLSQQLGRALDSGQGALTARDWDGLCFMVERMLLGPVLEVLRVSLGDALARQLLDGGSVAVARLATWTLGTLLRLVRGFDGKRNAWGVLAVQSGTVALAVRLVEAAVNASVGAKLARDLLDLFAPWAAAAPAVADALLVAPGGLLRVLVRGSVPFGPCAEKGVWPRIVRVLASARCANDDAQWPAIERHCALAAPEVLGPLRRRLGQVLGELSGAAPEHLGREAVLEFQLVAAMAAGPPLPPAHAVGFQRLAARAVLVGIQAHAAPGDWALQLVRYAARVLRALGRVDALLQAAPGDMLDRLAAQHAALAPAPLAAGSPEQLAFLVSPEAALFASETVQVQTARAPNLAALLVALQRAAAEDAAETAEHVAAVLTAAFCFHWAWPAWKLRLQAHEEVMFPVAPLGRAVAAGGSTSSPAASLARVAAATPYGRAAVMTAAAAAATPQTHWSVARRRPGTGLPAPPASSVSRLNQALPPGAASWATAAPAVSPAFEALRVQMEALRRDLRALLDAEVLPKVHLAARALRLAGGGKAGDSAGSLRALSALEQCERALVHVLSVPLG